MASCTRIEIDGEKPDVGAGKAEAEISVSKKLSTKKSGKSILGLKPRSAVRNASTLPQHRHHGPGHSKSKSIWINGVRLLPADIN